MAVKKRRRAKPLLIFLIVTILLLIITCITWFVMCSPVNKESSAKIEVVIEPEIKEETSFFTDYFRLIKRIFQLAIEAIKSLFTK